MKWIIMILMAGVVVTLPTPVRADDPHPFRPNLRLFQEEMRSVADSVFAAVSFPPDSTVRTTIHPTVHAWYLEQQVIDAARSRGLTPSEAPDARIDAQFGIEEMTVTYENARRTWLFGEQIVDRRVTLNGSVKLVEQGTGSIPVARTFSVTLRDTVPVVSLESLETPGIPATHAIAPASGFFPSFVEPFVLIGSVAVAVYLLFSVRS
jgi:hypothetical protein